MEQLKPVGEQVVVLMDASSGIGRESTLRFARKGARIVVSARGLKCRLTGFLASSGVPFPVANTSPSSFQLEPALSSSYTCF